MWIPNTVRKFNEQNLPCIHNSENEKENVEPSIEYIAESRDEDENVILLTVTKEICGYTWILLF